MHHALRIFDEPVARESVNIDKAAAEPLDVAEIRDGRAVVKLNRTEAGLRELRADLANKSYDLTTVAGDREARADRLRCVNLRSAVEKLRKEKKAPAIEYGRLLDAEAKRITEAVLSIEDPIDQQIKADEGRRAAEKAERERAEAERIARHRRNLDTIRSYVGQAQGRSSATIQVGLAVVERMVAGDEWEEFKDEAQRTLNETVAALREMRDNAAAHEAEAARVEAQRVENERVAAEQRERQRQLDEQETALRTRMQDAGDAPQHEAHEAAQVRTQDRPATAEGGHAGERPAAAPTLTLGAIGRRLGFALTQAFIDSLGIRPAARDKNAVLYHETDWPRIKAALVKHIQELN